ncbi:glycoside hydrolase family 108 protein [Salinibius halmophilus]|uniref:glycoside hydrolase family 108 protein n=1 Tax=Salinibius halmophilus TaxID=1853216 RepID=UPI000E67331F|nr:putative peptidoglycan-binding domain-containing protein [Salinibius halmophilus]
MPTLKSRIIDGIIAVEGGYTNDPSDSGGETNFGILADEAREWGYSGAMKSMPRSLAVKIYSAKYWDAVGGDTLIAHSERVTEEVVDTAVNMGKGCAVKYLQRALNVLNRRGDMYDDIEVDGAIGPATFKALEGYLAKRDEETLVKALNCLQGAHYIELAERREKDEHFVYGWLKNRVRL